MVRASIPPSTCTQISRPDESAIRRASETLPIMSAMNDWPPKPGSTVMIKIMSSSRAISRTDSIEVPGLTAAPARAPAARRSRARVTGFRAASMWKVTLLAPASAYAGAQRSGSSIMRWQSAGMLTEASRLSTTGSPRVRFGTKWLSMTSR